MHFKRIIFLVAFLWLSTNIYSQDLNQTNYRYSPLYLNPAQAGGFYGSIRVGANYRDQGQKLLIEGYKTWQLYADMPIRFGFRKQDWIGVGIQAFGDKAGALPMSTSGALINLAYHFSIDKKQTQILSFGVQYGAIQRKIDVSKVIVESVKVDIDRLQDYNGQYSDLNLGLTYKYLLSKGQSFIVGVSMFHIRKPKYKGLVRDNYIDRRISIHSNYHIRINNRLYVQPEFIVSISGKSTNIVPQIKTFYKLKKDTRTKSFHDKVYFGVGYRMQDALEVMIGMKYKGYDFGIAYDITVSSASVYNKNQGGIEFGVFKIININKRPKVKPVIFCPRL